jgi:hypothetical protein
MRGLVAFFTPSRPRAVLLFFAALVIFGLLGVMIVAGLLQPRKWSLEIWLEGPGGRSPR